MIERMQITRLCAGTLFRIYFVGFVFTVYPIVIAAGVAAAFGADTLAVDNVHLHGWRALAGTIVVPPVFALFFALGSLVLTWPGLWLFSKFEKLTVTFYASTSNQSLQRTATGEGLSAEPSVRSAGGRP